MTTAKEVLDCPMQDNDSGALTIRGYLITLLTALWQQESGFNGKRPFGNSGWQFDVYEALLKAGMIDGDFDEEFQELNIVDGKAGDALIFRAIEALR